MECYRRAMLTEQTLAGRRENLSQASKLCAPSPHCSKHSIAIMEVQQIRKFAGSGPVRCTNLTRPKIESKYLRPSELQRSLSRTCLLALARMGAQYENSGNNNDV